MKKSWLGIVAFILAMTFCFTSASAAPARPVVVSPVSEARSMAAPALAITRAYELEHGRTLFEMPFNEAASTLAKIFGAMALVLLVIGLLALL